MNLFRTSILFKLKHDDKDLNSLFLRSRKLLRFFKYEQIVIKEIEEFPREGCFLYHIFFTVKELSTESVMKFLMVLSQSIPEDISIEMTQIKNTIQVSLDKKGEDQIIEAFNKKKQIKDVNNAKEDFYKLLIDNSVLN
ncbi:MAG: hypothetical protein JEY96_15000 [Bacteroidales bacterium]|nr:hypothetical protein [Bacteroidales bacterium]